MPKALLGFERTRLLRGVVVLGVFVDLQFLDDTTTQRAFWQHAPDRFADGAFGFISKHMFREFGLETARKQGVNGSRFFCLAWYPST